MPLPAQPRKTPRQSRSQATVDAIIEAAARILALRGFAKTTTNAVAETAGVSIGSLYQYFPNKESIIAAVRQRHQSRLEAAVLRGLGDLPTRPDPQGLTRLARALIAAHQEEAALHLRLEEVRAAGYLPGVAPVTDPVIERVRSMLKRHVAFDDKRALQAAACLVTQVLHSVVHAAVFSGPGGCGLDEDAREQLVQEAVVMLHGYVSGAMRPAARRHGRAGFD